MTFDHSSQATLTFKEQVALLVLGKIMSKEDYDKVFDLQLATEVDYELNGIHNTQVNVIENYIDTASDFALQMADIMDKKLNGNQQ